METPTEKTHTEKKTVLVIEDDRDMNELMCAILEKSGYRSISAFDWESAYKIMSGDHPDLILLDFMLPDANGSEVCRNISKNEKLKDVPVIVVSSLRDLPVKMSSLVAGAIRFINKPFSYDELIFEVERAIEKNHVPHTLWEEIEMFTKEKF